MLVDFGETAVHHDNSIVHQSVRGLKGMVEYSGQLPATEPLIDRVPFAEPFGQVPPRGSGAYDVQHPFKGEPVVLTRLARVSRLAGQQRFNQPPLAALDAETDAERWTFDPRAYEGGPVGAGPTGFKHRGIAYWSDGNAARIFLNSRDRLYSIDAATGQPDPDFSEGGSVLLTEGHVREVSRYEFDQTSPPVIFEDLVNVGSRVTDGVQREFDPPGTVQAFDARTG